MENPESEAGAVLARLTRIEEHVGFSERATEELHEAVLALSRRIDELAARLEGLARQMHLRTEPSPDHDKAADAGTP